MRNLAFALLVLGTGCASTATERLGLPPLRTVETIELNRYMGKWYEIASFPTSFQEGCSHTTADYAMRSDGDVDVLNRCIKEGEEDASDGRVRVEDPKEPGKLEVSFFRPFWGEYWILAVGPEYRWAVVGHPSRDYLWILSRAPQMLPELYAAILEQLTKQGYEVSRLRKTEQ